jgi:hypothetical protein
MRRRTDPAPNMDIDDRGNDIRSIDLGTGRMRSALARSHAGARAPQVIRRE